MQDEWLVVETEWLEDAACLDLPLDAPQNERMQGELLQRCRRCPVREQCLSYALDRGYKWGVYGGTTGNQRRTLPTEELWKISAGLAVGTG